MDNVAPRVIEEIEAAWPQQIEHLQKLIREPSTLGNEAGVQRLIASTFHDMGLAVHQFETDIGTLGSHPAFSPVEWDYRGRPNVVGVWHSRSSTGRSLVLNGHIDVVSPEPRSHWRYDPWGAEIVGDRLYGRGSCDMKSGVNAMIYAVRAIQRAGIELDGDLLLQSVIEEECSGNGTLACVERGFVADGCLIPEPANGDALVAQLGVLWCRVVVRGSAGHVMTAQQSINAIDKMYFLIQAMRQLEAEMNAEKHPAYADVQWPINFNPGIIHGGYWPSMVPAQCELEFRMSFYPGTSAQDAKTRVRQHLLAAAATDPWLKDHLPEITFYGYHIEGTVIDFDTSPVIQSLKRSHQAITGRPLQSRRSTGTTDTRYFYQRGIPATCYGPHGANLHGADEYVELPSLLEATKVIAAFILEWCGISSPSQTRRAI